MISSDILGLDVSLGGGTLDREGGVPMVLYPLVFTGLNVLGQVGRLLLFALLHLFAHLGQILSLVVIFLVLLIVAAVGDAAR